MFFFYIDSRVDHDSFSLSSWPYLIILLKSSCLFIFMHWIRSQIESCNNGANWSGIGSLKRQVEIWWWWCQLLLVTACLIRELRMHLYWQQLLREKKYNQFCLWNISWGGDVYLTQKCPLPSMKSHNWVFVRYYCPQPISLSLKI